MKTKFFICPICGNLVELIEDGGITMECCGQEMEELVPNTTGEKGEKHLPVVKKENNKLIVDVGSTSHPMEPSHLIKWIYVETENGGIRRDLIYGNAPKAEIQLGEEHPVAVYAYCNTHGLWAKKL